MVKVQDVMECIETLAPTHLAESWDNVGLMVGRRDQVVTNVLTVLDVTESAIEEAIEKNCNLIVSHHPLIFKGLKQITSDTVLGRMIARLVKSDIAVYSAHTNLDIAKGGLNDLAAVQLGLGSVEGLEITHQEGLCKIAVFVPVDHTEAVLTAMGDAGAGHIGNYSHCAYYGEGTGTFKPLEGADPFIGHVGEVAKVPEHRVETIVPKAQLGKVVAAMKNAHPYEEVAYEVYSLKEPANVETIGRQGILSDTLDLNGFMELVNHAFPQGRPRFGGARVKEIKKVALCTGAGAEFIKVAAKAGAQAFVTGDVKYHDMQLAKELGVVVADVGHFGTEIGAAGLLGAYIQLHFGKELTVLTSTTQEDFFF